MIARSSGRPAAPQPPAGGTQASPRLPQLDALRGVAALVVVVHHGFLSLPESDPVRVWCQIRPTLAIMTLGRPAVILFFTLSGFVLTLSLADAGGLRYCARRATRLLLPFWAALCFAALLYACVPRQHAAAFSPWFNGQWDAVSARDFVSAIPLLVGPGTFSFDHVTWSLLHELRLSLALPLILFTAQRLGTSACLAIGVALAAVAEVAIAREPGAFPTGYHGYLFDAPALLPSLAVSLRFLPAFALGAALATHIRRVTRWATDRPATTLALGLVGLAALSQRSEYVMMGGSALVVGAAATSACVARGFGNGPVRWLGRVSFSLYLTHLPILLALGLVLDGRFPTLTIVATSIGLSLLFAEVFYVLVEGPSIAASRALTARRSPDPSRARSVLTLNDLASRFRSDLTGEATYDGAEDEGRASFDPLDRRLIRRGRPIDFGRVH